MNKTLSWITAFAMGLLCVAPTMDYDIPVIVNSLSWLYVVVASGLVAFFLIFNSKSLNNTLKILLGYIFISSFFSQIPYFSFNAFILLTVTFCFFLMFKECDFGVFINMAQAVFCLEAIFMIMQYLGRDTLLNFGRQEPLVFGTITQHMRFGSLLCILSPFLIIKSKWYLIPILAAVILSTSSGFALSIAVGCIVYSILIFKKNATPFIFITTVFLIAFACVIGHDSFSVAFREGRLPVWWVVFKTWLMDTRGLMVSTNGYMVQSGPLDFKAIFFGHGLDTFYALFPAYKHDPAPFPQAHNDWLQLLWELGLVGFCLFSAYCVWLIERLYRLKEYLLIAGLSIIATNMLVHFPIRMTQTVLLMVVFVAYCEQQIKEGFQYADIK